MSVTSSATSFGVPKTSLDFPKGAIRDLTLLGNPSENPLMILSWFNKSRWPHAVDDFGAGREGMLWWWLADDLVLIGMDSHWRH